MLIDSRRQIASTFLYISIERRFRRGGHRDAAQLPLHRRGLFQADRRAISARQLSGSSSSRFLQRVTDQSTCNSLNRCQPAVSFRSVLRSDLPLISRQHPTAPFLLDTPFPLNRSPSPPSRSQSTQLGYRYPRNDRRPSDPLRRIRIRVGLAGVTGQESSRLSSA